VTERIGDVVVEVVSPGPGRAGAVVHATLDRPEARNPLGLAMLDGLAAAVGIAAEQEAAALVVRGAGGTLSAGADLRHVRALGDDPAGMHGYLERIGEVLDALEAAQCVTIAVVGAGGYALAGGCELLLACDLAVVAADAGIGDRHLQYGLLPGAGGSVRLPRALPPALARRLLVTGEIVDGATAHAWGLVSHVAPPAELDAAVDALLARLARHSVPALYAMTRLARASIPPADPGALAAERDAVVLHLTTSATVREGLDAFTSGRRPDFSADRLATWETP
jgi:enoyl-CoA hydratase/carnithine racemase